MLKKKHWHSQTRVKSSTWPFVRTKIFEAFNTAGVADVIGQGCHIRRCRSTESPLCQVLPIPLAFADAFNRGLQMRLLTVLQSENARSVHPSSSSQELLLTHPAHLTHSLKRARARTHARTQSRSPMNFRVCVRVPII